MWTVEAQLKKFQRGTIFATQVEKIPVILLAKKEKEGGGLLSSHVLRTCLILNFKVID